MVKKNDKLQIKPVKKKSRREVLLEEGLRVFHVQGYIGATIRDICRAAGSPLGSFTNYFNSKEEFALEILAIYDALVSDVRKATFLNEDIPHRKRVHAYLDAIEQVVDRDECRIGCLIGNFSIDASVHSEVIRIRLTEALKRFEQDVETCMTDALKVGAVGGSLNARAFAADFVSGLYGAIMMTKVERNSDALRRFREMIDRQLDSYS